MTWPAGTIDKSALAVAIYEAFNLEMTQEQLKKHLDARPHTRKVREYVEAILGNTEPRRPAELDDLLAAVKAYKANHGN